MSEARIDTREMLFKVSAVRRQLPGYVGSGLYQELRDVEVPECQRIVPVLTGALHDTIRAIGPFFEGNRISAAITAGSDEVDYAEKVHEDLDAFHPHGQAKYIEEPFLEARPFLGARVAKRMQLSGIKI